MTSSWLQGRSIRYTVMGRNKMICPATIIITIIGKRMDRFRLMIFNRIKVRILFVQSVVQL
jgi:hypothetical protein